MTLVEFSLGVNGNDLFCAESKPLISIGLCIPRSLVGAMFGDMADARYGAVYNTQ